LESRNRDLGISRICAREGTYASGMGLGVMLLDEVYPGFPGDVRNASAYPFPIQYDVVENVDIPKLVHADDKSGCLSPILEAARRLERMGCRAIAAECGYFAYFQREVAGQVGVPVFMSSLLQVPLMQQVVGVESKVGILCAFRSRLSDDHLRKVGIDPGPNVVIAGTGDDYETPHFDSLWAEGKRPAVPTSDFDAAAVDFLAVCKDFVARNPEVKALLFECTGFQPFARIVQREIGLPIFSWSTLLDFAFSVVSHREHYGHV
jgi:hypothetical protein